MKESDIYKKENPPIEEPKKNLEIFQDDDYKKIRLILEKRGISEEEWERIEQELRTILAEKK